MLPARKRSPGRMATSGWSRPSPAAPVQLPWPVRSACRIAPGTFPPELATTSSSTCWSRRASAGSNCARATGPAEDAKWAARADPPSAAATSAPAALTTSVLRSKEWLSWASGSQIGVNVAVHAGHRCSSVRLGRLGHGVLSIYLREGLPPGGPSGSGSGWRLWVRLTPVSTRALAHPAWRLAVALRPRLDGASRRTLVALRLARRACRRVRRGCAGDRRRSAAGRAS